MAQGTERRFPSPLRYPGGKGKIANFFKLLFLESDLVGHEYVELYAGGAGVALSLLFEEYASHIHINDLNRSVHAFWRAAVDQTEELCARINDTAVTIEEWERQQAVQSAAEPEPLDLAFSTFFLSRTNRSGIIAGGMIGGRDQQGKWGLAARYNKPDLIRRIKKVARYRSRITITQIDAAEYLRTVAPNLPAATFLYLDPPYYVKGEGLYEHFYTHQDHSQIAQLVSDLNHPWVVSYDAADEILEFYREYDPLVYTLSYSAQDRYHGSEAMFFHPDLEPPSVVSPAKIGAHVVDRRRLALLPS